MISLPSITEVKQQLFKTAKRFPLPTLFASLITILGICLIHDTFDSVAEDWAIKTLLTAILGLAAFTGLTLAFENSSFLKRNLAMGTGVGLLGLYFYMLPANFDYEGSLWVSRHIFLCLTAVVTFFWAPYWKQNADNKVLWHWSSLLIGSAVITVFFAFVLFIGLAAALWAIDSLFGLGINGELYLDIWVIIAALFSPLFWLSQFHPKPLKLKAPKQVPAFMSIFTNYIMTPLALGYLVILYTYTAKILITWEWPKNVLGWLVIAFLGVAIFTYFLWTPLLKPAFEKYRRIFWLTLIPQIFLLFVAIGWRIHAYSWTENRYFVVVLGLWLLGTTVYFLIHRQAKFKWIFVALTSIIFVSQIGPLSGYAIGEKSQTSRLMTLLEDVNVKQGNTFKKIAIESNTEAENQIASILDYLKDRHGEDTLKAPFSNLDYTDVERYDLPRFIMESYGLNYRHKYHRSRDWEDPTYNYRSFSADIHSPKQISGFDWHIYPAPSSKREEYPPINGYRFELEQASSSDEEDLGIQVYFKEQPISFISVADKYKELINIIKEKERESLKPEITFIEHESEFFSMRIYLTSGWRHSDGDTSFDAELYVRFKDQRPNLTNREEIEGASSSFSAQ